jgi:hypothetical protein
MIALTFGKHKNEMLEMTPESYIKWLATHKAVLSVENRHFSDLAKELLERRAQVVAQEVALKEFEARKEAEMAVKIAQHIIATPAKVDLAFKGSSNVSRAFSLLR